LTIGELRLLHTERLTRLYNVIWHGHATAAERMLGRLSCAVLALSIALLKVATGGQVGQLQSRDPNLANDATPPPLG